MSKINLQEPQRNRNANANFVNLIRTSTVAMYFYKSYSIFFEVFSVTVPTKGSGTKKIMLQSISMTKPISIQLCDDMDQDRVPDNMGFYHILY